MMMLVGLSVGWCWLFKFQADFELIKLCLTGWAIHGVLMGRAILA